MAQTIIVSGMLTASNTDILQGGRLQTVPENGLLTFEMQASDNVAANNFVASIQLPDGNTPMNGVQVPGGATAGLAGIIDERTDLKASFPISQGGHCVFSAVEVGDTEMTFRVTYTPFRPG